MSDFSILHSIRIPLCASSAPIQLTFFVYLIRNRLILITEELNDIQNIFLNVPNEPIFVNSSGNTPSINNRLLNLKQIYGKLHDSCELWSNAFGISILANTIETFIDFTAHAYWGVHVSIQFSKVHSTHHIFGINFSNFGNTCFLLFSIRINSFKNIKQLFCSRAVLSS